MKKAKLSPRMRDVLLRLADGSASSIEEVNPGDLRLNGGGLYGREWIAYGTFRGLLRRDYLKKIAGTKVYVLSETGRQAAEGVK